MLTNELFCGACQLLTKLDFAVSLSCALQTLFPFHEPLEGDGSAAPRLGQMGDEARLPLSPHQETGQGMDETSLRWWDFCCCSVGRGQGSRERPQACGWSHISSVRHY